MKVYIFRLLSVLFLASVSSMLLWHFFTYRGPLDVQQISSGRRCNLPPVSNGHEKDTGTKTNIVTANPTLLFRKLYLVFNKIQEVQISCDFFLWGYAKEEVNKALHTGRLSNIQNNRAYIEIDEAAVYLSKLKHNPLNSKECGIIDKLLASYRQTWVKQDKNFKSFRSLLGISCNAITNAVVTQDNSPVGTNIAFNGEQTRIMVVTPDLFNLFPKENPFKGAPWHSCAVVGNGGILANSSCGKQINSATYVIRCNLPPVSNGHEKDTGTKTNIVTANPTLLFRKYQSLTERRQPFLEDMQLYGNALIFLPAFSFGMNTAVSLRALYALEDHSNSGPRAVFFNPGYLKSLAYFWRGQGLREVCLSTGIMMASLALELCNNVHLYGFWPFESHPYTYQQLTNHYYDNQPVHKGMHSMPAEFEALLKLHNKGVIHLHLGECTN